MFDLLIPNSPHLLILFEAAWKASIIPLAHETAFFAMKSFGNYNMHVALLLAIIGATIGQVFNWFLGKIIVSYESNLTVSDYWVERVSTLFKLYGWPLLLFSWVPLCNLLVVLAGFARLRLRVAVPLIILGQTAHYGWYLL